MVQTTQIRRKLAKKRALKARMKQNASLVPPIPILPTETRPLTGPEIAKQLVESGAFGAWADRTDIIDSAEYVQQLRRPALSTTVNSTVRPKPGALADLMAQWRAEDETDDEEELTQRDVEIEEFNAYINGDRVATRCEGQASDKAREE